MKALFLHKERVSVFPDVVHSREANALAQQRGTRAPLLRVYERSVIA